MKNSKKIIATTLLLFLYVNSYSQEYYSFSNKVGGDYCENNMFTLTGSVGTGIGMKFSSYTSIEYGFKNFNASVGINFLFHKYQKVTLFEFQSEKANNVLGIVGKKYFYPGGERFSLFGATGLGIFLQDSENSISFLAEIGSKYKITKNFGVLLNIYTTGNLDVATGLGISISY